MRNRCIVVVDDDRSILSLLCELFEDEGFVVVCLPDPARLPAFAPEQDEPQLFFLDMMLTGTTGIDVARTLRTNRYPTTPMVAMSASQVMLDTAARSELFHETIAKPFDLATVVDIAQRYTG